MRPDFQPHSAARHGAEDFLQRFPRCTHSLFQLYSASFIQHAVPRVAITQIQSDSQFLPRNIPALLCHCGANLLHCRSPFSLCLEHVDTWERTASRRRPAFSSHLITTIMINFRRSSGGKPKRSARGSALDARRVARDAERNPPSVLQTLLAYGKSGTVSRYLSVFESVCVWQRIVSYQS